MFDFLIGAALIVQQDAYPAPRDPCIRYEAAMAPMDTDSRLCGLSIHEGDVRVHYSDGRILSAGPAPQRPARYTAEDVQYFWVMRRGDTAFIGVRGVMDQNVSVVVRDEQRGWYTEAVACGRLGPDHVFGWSDNGEYALVGSYDENYGRASFCMVNLWRGGQEEFTIETENGIDFRRVQIEWRPCRSEDEYGASCMTFVVRDWNGQEIFGSTP
jgi:hypothetical protein